MTITIQKISKIKLPNKLKIFGKLVRVDYTTEILDTYRPHTHGQCDTENSFIRIRSDFDIQYQLDTLIHECLHFVFGTLGFYNYNSDEVLIQTIASGVTDVLLNNPEMVKAILKIINENNKEITEKK